MLVAADSLFDSILDLSSKPFVKIDLEGHRLAFEDLLVVYIHKSKLKLLPGFELQCLPRFVLRVRYFPQFEEDLLSTRRDGRRLFAPEDQGPVLRVQNLDLDIAGEKVLVRGVEKSGLPWRHLDTLAERGDMLHRLQNNLNLFDLLRPGNGDNRDELDNLRSQAGRTKAHLEEVRKGRPDVDKAEREAGAAQRFMQARENLARLHELLEQVRVANDDLERWQMELSKTVAPDAKTLKALRKAFSSRGEAQVRLDAALITLEIVPEASGRIEILYADESGQERMKPGTALAVEGSPEVVVAWEGVARIRAQGPAENVEELRKEVNNAERKIQSLTAGFGTTEIDELETGSEQSRLVQQKVSHAQTRLETLLSGKSVEEIEQERQKQQTILEEIAVSLPGWNQSPPDADSLRDRAETTRDDFINRVEEAERKKKTAELAYQQSNLKHATLQTELASAVRKVRSISTNLEETLWTVVGLRDTVAHETVHQSGMHGQRCGLTRRNSPSVPYFYVKGYSRECPTCQPNQSPKP